jgi:hypothetical protein
VILDIAGGRAKQFEGIVHAQSLKRSNIERFTDPFERGCSRENGMGPQIENGAMTTK